jgi:hypothetical protein
LWLWREILEQGILFFFIAILTLTITIAIIVAIISVAPTMDICVETGYGATVVASSVGRPRAIRVGTKPMLAMTMVMMMTGGGCDDQNDDDDGGHDGGL